MPEREHGPTAPSPITLHNYQRDALDAVDTLRARECRRQLIVLPTGTGKSTITAQLPQRLGTPLLLLAHRKELIDQHYHQMVRANPTLRIGIEQAGRRCMGDEPVVIGCIPTLGPKDGHRLQRLRERPWTTVVADEAHHTIATTWRRVLTGLRCFQPDGPLLIGTTATPTRGDRIGLSAVFEAIAYHRSLRDMIHEGWCTQIRPYAVRTDSSLDTVHVERGDFVESELARAVNTPRRNAIVVEAYRRLSEGRRALVFCVDCVHAEALALSFRRAHFRAAALTNLLDDDVRAERLAAFKAGDLQILTNIAILTEGFDDPPLACILMARPTRSPLFYEQSLGRCTRIFPGKSDSLVLDFVDNTTRHQIQTTASLFGLPPTTNLRGRSVHEFAQEMEDLLGKHPHLAAQTFASVPELLQAAREADLSITPVEIIPALAPEVRTEAGLVWVRLPTNEYLLPIEGFRALRIRQNLLDQYEILTLPDRSVMQTHKTRPEAFRAAERWLATTEPQRYRLVSQNAPWHRLPTSEEQRQFLASHNLQVPKTRGESSLLITQVKAQTQARWQDRPATPKQRAYLEPRGLWKDGMTMGQASAKITERKAAEHEGNKADGTAAAKAPEVPAVAEASEAPITPGESPDGPAVRLEPVTPQDISGSSPSEGLERRGSPPPP